MKEKLKELLHMRKKSSEPNSPRTSYEQSESNSPRSPHTAQHSASHANYSHQTGRIRPLSSGYDDGRAGNSTTSKPFNVNYTHAGNSTAPKSSNVNRAPSNHSDINGSIADDYKSYLPALSPVQDSNDEQYGILDSDRRPIGESDGLHEEDVANKNIDRYRSSLDAGHSKPLPAVPAPLNTGHDYHTKQSTGTGPVGSTIRAVPSGTSSGKAHHGGLAPSTRPHKDVSPRDNAQVDPSRMMFQGSSSDNKALGSSRQDMAVKSSPDNSLNKGHGVMNGGKDWKEKQQSLLKGVVDLRNTVETDQDVQWAAPVTHEVFKPHEHEIVQHRLYRETHNYTHYHRLQPVLQTEVLPPRHFIPNPNGEGLIEISADELPARTGKNRWWDIVQKEPQYPESVYQWRTEPEVIEGKPYMTEEGFERRETTTIYPPTLEDMSSYSGMVQPVHFDHKTGKRWLGEVTTMEKLKQEVDQMLDADFITMKEVTSDLPDVPSSPTVKRKPVDSEFV